MKWVFLMFGHKSRGQKPGSKIEHLLNILRQKHGDRQTKTKNWTELYNKLTREWSRWRGDGKTVKRISQGTWKKRGAGNRAGQRRLMKNRCAGRHTEPDTKTEQRSQWKNTFTQSHSDGTAVTMTAAGSNWYYFFRSLLFLFYFNVIFCFSFLFQEDLPRWTVIFLTWSYPRSYQVFTSCPGVQGLHYFGYV